MTFCGNWGMVKFLIAEICFSRVSTALSASFFAFSTSLATDVASDNSWAVALLVASCWLFRVFKSWMLERFWASVFLASSNLRSALSLRDSLVAKSDLALSRSSVTPGKRFSDEARLSFASCSFWVASVSFFEARFAPPWALVKAFAVLASSSSAWVLALSNKASCSAFLASALFASFKFFVTLVRVASFLAKSDLALSRSFVMPATFPLEASKVDWAVCSAFFFFFKSSEAWFAAVWALSKSPSACFKVAVAWFKAFVACTNCSAFLASAPFAFFKTSVAFLRLASLVAKSVFALSRSLSIAVVLVPLRTDWALSLFCLATTRADAVSFALSVVSWSFLAVEAFVFSASTFPSSNLAISPAFLASIFLASSNFLDASARLASLVARSALAFLRSFRIAVVPVPSKTAWALSLFFWATVKAKEASLWACVAFERASVAWSKVFFCPTSRSFSSLNLRAFVASAFCDCSKAFLASFTIAFLASESFLASFSSLRTCSAPVPFRTSWAFLTFFFASATFPACFWVASISSLTTVSCASFFFCTWFCCSFKESIFSVCVVTSFLEVSIPFFVSSIAWGVAEAFFCSACSSACLALLSTSPVVASCSLAFSTTGVWSSTAWSAWFLISSASLTISSVGAFITRAVPFETSTPSTWVMAVVGEVCTCFSSATVLSVDFTSTCSSAFTDNVEKLVNATPAAKARVIFLFFLLFLDFIFTHINLKRICSKSKSFT